MLRNDLRLYIRQACHVIEPSTVYLENWHIDLIAEHLEAVTAGRIKRPFTSMLQNRRAQRFCGRTEFGRGNVSRQAAQSGLEGPGTKWVFASTPNPLHRRDAYA